MGGNFDLAIFFKLDKLPCDLIATLELNRIKIYLPVTCVAHQANPLCFMVISVNERIILEIGHYLKFLGFDVFTTYVYDDDLQVKMSVVQGSYIYSSSYNMLDIVSDLYCKETMEEIFKFLSIGTSNNEMSHFVDFVHKWMALE